MYVIPATTIVLEAWCKNAVMSQSGNKPSFGSAYVIYRDNNLYIKFLGVIQTTIRM